MNCGIVELALKGWPVFCIGKGFVLGGCCWPNAAIPVIWGSNML